MTKEKIMTMFAIAKRAEELGALRTDRISLKMDLEIFDNEVGLKLDELLNANEFDFVHDIVGIQNHVDRQNMTLLDNQFLPRYAQ